MHSYSITFPLLAISLLNGAPVQSNSPHSPYTQLKVLSEEVSTLKETLEKMKPAENISEALLNENKQLASKIEQLEVKNKQLDNGNKALQDQLNNLNEFYKKQTEDLLALSNEFKKFRSEVFNENNSCTIKNRELVSVKKDISQLKETLNSTQDEMGNFERKLADNDTKTSQKFQEQLQKIKSELMEFCQSTNQKLQDFSEQIKNNLTKVANNTCIKHTIVSGESLASIARRYNTTPDQILSANHLQDTRGLHVGDTLLVPQEVF